MSDDPFFVVDGAHNPAALQRSLEAYQRRLSRPGASGDGAAAASRNEESKALLIFGCMEDKEVEEMLALLAACPLRILFTAARQPRALPPEFFTAHALAEGRDWESCPDLKAALEHAGSARPILVTGSFYLAAEAYWLKGVDPFGAR